MAIGAAVGVFDRFGHGTPGEPHEAAFGSRRDLTLADGSHLTLNTNTRLRIEMDPRRRAIWLDRGEAYFEVAHDPLRPFVVHAGDRDVTAVGTRFSVRREYERLKVQVLEGRVRISTVTSVASGPLTLLEPNDVAPASTDAVLITRRSLTQAAGDLAWRTGRLMFDGVSLCDAATEFNRYNKKRLVVLGPAGQTLRLGGSFAVDNVEAFARLLHDGLGLKVVDLGDRIEVRG